MVAQELGIAHHTVCKWRARVINKGTTSGRGQVKAQGLTASAIAPRVRLDRKTVRRFANAELASDLLGLRGGGLPASTHTYPI